MDYRTKQGYKSRVQAQLKLWSARRGTFQERASQASAEVRVDLLRRVEVIEQLEAAARRHIAEVDSASVEHWSKIRSRFEQRWSHLAGSAEAIWAKIAPGTTDRN